MPIPATLIFKFASETAESTSSGQLIVPALRTSPVSTEGTVPVSMDASRASLTLSGVNDARDASMDTGTVPSVLTGEVLSAGTISWPDEVDSAVSLANLNMNVAWVGITADSVVAQASQVLGAAGSGTSYIDNLSINGIPVAVTGAPNQTVWVPGGQVIINEQTISSTGAAVVNALHVAITGVADVVIASATAGIS